MSERATRRWLAAVAAMVAAGSQAASGEQTLAVSDSWQPTVKALNGVVMPACPQLAGSVGSPACEPEASHITPPGNGSELAAGGLPLMGTCVVPGYDDRCERSAGYSGVNHRFERVLRTVSSADGRTLYVAGYRGFFQTLKDQNMDFFAAAFDVGPQLVNTSGTVTYYQPLWVQQINGLMDSRDFARDLVLSPDGRKLYVTGSIVDDWFYNNVIPVDEDHPQGRSYATFAFDAATGKQLWRSGYRNGWNSVNDSVAVAASPDGKWVVVTGTSSNDARDASGIATVAYDSETGEQAWVARHEASKGFGHAVYDITVTPSGSVAVTGAAWKPGASWYGVQTMIYPLEGPSAGTPSWSVLDGTRLSQGLVVLTDESRVYVGGFAPHTGSLPLTTNKTYAVAYDLTTGVVAWSDSYVGQFEGPHLIEAGALSPSGGQLAFGGYAMDAGAKVAALTIAYDPLDGQRAWVGRHAKPGDHISRTRDVTFSKNGATVYAVGDAQAGLAGGGGATLFLGTFGVGGMAITEGPSDMVTQAFDAATGAANWTARFNFAGADTHVGASVAVHPVSGVVTTVGTAWFGTQVYTPTTGTTNPNGWTWFAHYSP